MPAYSGLWNGIHDQAYNNMPKSDAVPPMMRGIVRVIMQGRGAHGHVSALGRNAPASIAQVPAEREDNATIRGAFDYAGWKIDPTGDHNSPWAPADGNNLAAQTNTNNGTTLAGGTGVALESIARPADATAEDLAHTYDTTLNNAYAADEANSGQTATKQDEVISDGT